MKKLLLSVFCSLYVMSLLSVTPLRLRALWKMAENPAMYKQQFGDLPLELKLELLAMIRTGYAVQKIKIPGVVNYLESPRGRIIAGDINAKTILSYDDNTKTAKNLGSVLSPIKKEVVFSAPSPYDFTVEAKGNVLFYKGYSSDGKVIEDRIGLPGQIIEIANGPIRSLGGKSSIPSFKQAVSVLWREEKVDAVAVVDVQKRAIIFKTFVTKGHRLLASGTTLFVGMDGLLYILDLEKYFKALDMLNFGQYLKTCDKEKDPYCIENNSDVECAWQFDQVLKNGLALNPVVDPS